MDEASTVYAVNENFMKPSLRVVLSWAQLNTAELGARLGIAATVRRNSASSPFSGERNTHLGGGRTQSSRVRRTTHT